MSSCMEQAYNSRGWIVQHQAEQAARLEFQGNGKGYAQADLPAWPH